MYLAVCTLSGADGFFILLPAPRHNPSTGRIDCEYRSTVNLFEGMKVIMMGWLIAIAIVVLIVVASHEKAESIMEFVEE